MPGDGGVFLRRHRAMDGINIVTIHRRLPCPDLDCGAEFFGHDLASYLNSSISVIIIKGIYTGQVRLRASNATDA